MRIINYSHTNSIIYGSPRGCFGNARDYVLGDCEGDGDMRYCEGLLYYRAERVAIHHAWAVDVCNRENYEVSPQGLFGDLSNLLYFGCIVGRRRLRSRSPADGTVGPFFAFRELGPMKERVRRLHPVEEFCRAMRDSDPCPCGSGKKWNKCHGVATTD